MIESKKGGGLFSEATKPRKKRFCVKKNLFLLDSFNSFEDKFNCFLGLEQIVGDQK